jgi:hypothetical protein
VTIPIGDSGAPPVTPIPSIRPRSAGHQFVIYGDSCSGIAGASHAANFKMINAVVRRLDPPPEFIAFLGDEIVGLTIDGQELMRQWRYWLDVEMGWLDRGSIPLFHTTSNHTTFDEGSEKVFREVLTLPQNGPPGQEGLSYHVRRQDLLLVFVHTSWSGLGGEGHIECSWLESVLEEHAGARYKLVLGHHPVFPVNGYAGSYQREIGPEYTRRFWDILVKNHVVAYVCSHILAFDAQVQQGVLQLCTAGAGTAHRMPEGSEYLHCAQMALDAAGMRYQVLDIHGVVREQLSWPIPDGHPHSWIEVGRGESPALFQGYLASASIVMLRIRGRTAARPSAPAQTIFSAFHAGIIAPLWLGLRGEGQVVTIILGPHSGRSPHYWFGPALPPGGDFELHLAFHPDLGPGGLLYRRRPSDPWSSLTAAAASGIERLDWPARWSIGHGQGGVADRPFRGPVLEVAAAVP